MTTTKTELPELVFAEGATGSFGDVNIPDEAFLPKNVRVRISIMIPGDVLDKLRELGEKQHKGYQTVANEILRSAVMEGDVGSILALKARVEEVAKRADAAYLLAFGRSKKAPAQAAKKRAKR